MNGCAGLTRAASARRPTPAPRAASCTAWSVRCTRYSACPAGEHDAMTELMHGGCAGGRVRYRVSIGDDEAYLCHCRMCQRATGSVSIAFKNVKKADVTGQSEPDWVAS